MNWKIRTEDARVSLHDHLITNIQFGNDILLYFEDGFDVTRENAANLSGRHKQTGEAAVILYNAKLMDAVAVKYLSDESEKKITMEEFAALDFEVKSNSFKEGILELFGDAFEENLFCKLQFKVDKIEYCWNEFVDDAWFQLD